MLKEKIWANFQRIIDFFTQKIVTSSQKYGFGIRDPEKPIPDPGTKGTGSWIRIRNTVCGIAIDLFFLLSQAVKKLGYDSSH